jgi:hypothetical protein
MSNETPTPPQPAATKTPKAKKDLALQSCIRLLFFMYESMRAQGVEKTMLGTSVLATLQLCSHALPNEFKLSETEAQVIRAKAKLGAAQATAAANTQAPSATLPEKGQFTVLRPDQFRKPIKTP